MAKAPLGRPLAAGHGEALLFAVMVGILPHNYLVHLQQLARIWEAKGVKVRSICPGCPRPKLKVGMKPAATRVSIETYFQRPSTQL